MFTVGQAIGEFLNQLEQQGQSQKVLTTLSGVLRRQFLWEVFCLIPRNDFPKGYLPTQVQVGKSPGTVAEYKRYWTLFHRFLETSSINYLTMGDAYLGFLNSFQEAGLAHQTYLSARSCIKLLGREYASNLPLSVIDDRIVMTIWQRGKQRSNYARRKIGRFLRYLQEQGYLSCRLYKRHEPKWKRELKALINSSVPCLGPHSLFTECLGPYFRYCIDAKNQTEAGLKSHCEKLRFFSRWLGPAAIGTVDLDKIEQYLLYLQEERNNGLAALKGAAVVLKSFFSFLAQEGILPANPLAPLKVKQSQVLSRTALTPDELTRLLAAARQLDRQSLGGTTERIKRFLAARDAAILEILTHTGIRSGELRALTLDRVNLKCGYLDISGKGSVRHYKKERRVYIEFEQTRQALADYLAVRPAEFGPICFTTKNGNPLKAKDVIRIVSRCARAAGLSKHITPHDLRASFASMLIAGGVDPLTLKVLMGHENLSTTLKSYVSLEQEQLREIWKKCNPLANLPPRNGGDK